MKKILEIGNIEVRYNTIKALKGISIAINEGEIVSLIGANGAGKSTLLKAIVGLEPLSNGRIDFFGETIADYKLHGRKNISTDGIIAKGISLVPEGRGVFSDMIVKENLEMGAFLSKDRLYVSNKLEQMYSLFPILKDRRLQKAGSLSGGEQQMLSIARALMSSPKLLLLDEPGLGLAPLVIRDIFQTIRDINKNENVTVFLVEQNARQALKLSNRGLVMETGTIVLEDDSVNLLENKKVKSAYLGENY